MKQITASLDKSRFVDAKVHVADANVKINKFASPEGKGQAPPWAAVISVLDSELNFKHHPKVDVHVDIRGDNARPIYAFLNTESKGAVPSWLPELVPFTKLRFQAHFILGDGAFSAQPIVLTADNSSLQGRLRQSAEGSWGLFLFKAGPIAAALEIEKDKTRLRLQDATHWYRKRERETAHNYATP